MTAKDFIEKRLNLTDDGEPISVHDSVTNVAELMVEFTLYHREQMVKAVMRESQLPDEDLDYVEGMYNKEFIE